VLPNWLGEDIPVSFEAAQEVGRLRREIAVAVREKGRSRALGDLLPGIVRRYPVERTAAVKFFDYIAEQLAGGKEDRPVPDHRTVTMEIAPRICIINACFGTRVNETLGQLISSQLAQRYGASVGVNTDPYRIMLETPCRIYPDHLEEILMSVEPTILGSIMRRVLRSSPYLKWQMLHTAKKFGAIAPDADYRNLHMGRLMESYEHTPLFEEAVNKVLWDRMHLANTRRILGRIQEGSIRIAATGLTPIGLAGIEHRRELMVPQRATAAILKAMKKRIGAGKVRLLCMNCGITRRTKVEDLEEGPLTCRVCEGSIIACMMPWDDELIDAVKGFIRGRRKRLKPWERKAFERLKKNANLVSEYGKRAVYALSARGVAEGNAARILAGIYDSEDDFFKALLAAEVNYARTKRFWD